MWFVLRLTLYEARECSSDSFKGTKYAFCNRATFSIFLTNAFMSEKKQKLLVLFRQICAKRPVSAHMYLLSYFRMFGVQVLPYFDLY